MNDQGEDDVREHWGLARRGAATSCRSVRISASFAASERASSASQPNTRTSVKYASRKVTARDHAGPARDGDAEGRPTEGAVQARDRVLGTHDHGECAVAEAWDRLVLDRTPSGRGQRPRAQRFHCGLSDLGFSVCADNRATMGDLPLPCWPTVAADRP
jgi:hypothetical protein